MMRSSVFSSIVIFLFPLFALGQLPGGGVEDNDPTFALPEIIKPSPTVASLMNLEEVPVDHYTGQPDINLPLFSKEIKKDIQVPIVLKYSTQGVKVSERSGWTGTGWSLEAGGTISRTVRGFPDEANPTAPKIGTGIYHLPNNAFFDYDNLSDPEKNEYIWKVGGTSDERYDSQLDLYQFNILGKTGRFVLIKINSSTLMPKMLSKNENIKIEVFTNPDLSVSSFKVTDGNGNKYTFGGNNAHEVTTSVPWSISYLVDGSPTAPNELEARATTTSISAWHLTKITTSNNKPLANFTYTSAILEEYDSYENSTTYTFDNPNNNWSSYYNGFGGQNPHAAYNTFAFKPHKVLTGNFIDVQTKKLSKIVFNDGTSVHFVLKPTSHPEHGGGVLGSVKLKGANGQIHKSYGLSYETSPAGRLWLMQVYESGSGVAFHPYDLGYFEKEDLPEFGQGDAWGYNPAFSQQGNDYDFNAYKKGLLTSMSYPTGGVKEFIWEPHTFSYEGDDLLSESATDKNPMNFYNKTTNAIFEADGQGCGSSNFSSDPSPVEGFTIEAPSYVRVSINIIGESQEIPNVQQAGSKSFTIYIKEQGVSGSIVGWVPLSSGNGSTTVFLSPGNYTYYLGCNQMPNAGGPWVEVGVNIQYKEKKHGGAYNQYLMAGGARIAEVVFKEDASATGNERHIMYYYNEPNPLEPITGGPYFIDSFGPHVKSSGSVDTKVGSMRREYHYNHKAMLKTGAGCDIKTIGYEVTTNQPNISLTKGGYVGYKYVRVREKIEGTFDGKGYIAYTYSSPQDWPMPSSVFNYPFSQPPNIDYKRGLLLKKEIFDEDNEKLEEVVKAYSYVEEAIATNYTHSEIPCGWKAFYDNYGDYISKSPTFPLPCASDQADNCGNWAPYGFSSNTLKACWAKLDSSHKKEYFPAGSANYISSHTEYVYNDENYKIKRKAQTINEGNEANQYITEYEYPVGGYATSLFTASENSVIDQMAGPLNVVNKPVVVSTYKNTKPLLKVITKYKLVHGQAVIGEMESLKGNMAEGEDRVVFHRYDNWGNPLEVSLKNGNKVCYIWGYGESLPVAKIENISDYQAISSTTIDAIKMASAPATYSEAALINAFNTLRGELPNSQVTTFVYDPGKGLKSVTDPRGYTTSYEYDEFSRLEYIRDADGNILQHYDYNYRLSPFD